MDDDDRRDGDRHDEYVLTMRVLRGLVLTAIAALWTFFIYDRTLEHMERQRVEVPDVLVLPYGGTR